MYMDGLWMALRVLIKPTEGGVRGELHQVCTATRQPGRGLCAAVTGGYLGYNQFVKQKPVQAATAVRMVPVQRGNLPHGRHDRQPGASEQAKLSFKSGGKLKELNVRVGDAVKAGTVLAKLETTDLEFTLART